MCDVFKRKHHIKVVNKHSATTLLFNPDINVSVTFQSKGLIPTFIGISPASIQFFTTQSLTAKLPTHEVKKLGVG
jgi:hypothetical protein